MCLAMRIVVCCQQLLKLSVYQLLTTYNNYLYVLVGKHALGEHAFLKLKITFICFLFFNKTNHVIWLYKHTNICQIIVLLFFTKNFECNASGSGLIRKFSTEANERSATSFQVSHSKSCQKTFSDLNFQLVTPPPSGEN